MFLNLSILIAVALLCGGLRVGTHRIHHGLESIPDPTFDINLTVRSSGSRRIAVNALAPKRNPHLFERTLYGRTTVSAQSGYRKLLRTNTNNYTKYTGNCVANISYICTTPIEEWITEDDGEMDGLVVTACTISFNSFWSKSGTKLSPNVKEIWFRIYHRNNGTETQLSTDLKTSVNQIDTTYADRPFSAFTAQLFEPGDRFVIKSLARLERGEDV